MAAGAGQHNEQEVSEVATALQKYVNKVNFIGFAKTKDETIGNGNDVEGRMERLEKGLVVSLNTVNRTHGELSAVVASALEYSNTVKELADAQKTLSTKVSELVALPWSFDSEADANFGKD